MLVFGTQCMAKLVKHDAYKRILILTFNTAKIHRWFPGLRVVAVDTVVSDGRPVPFPAVARAEGNSDTRLVFLVLCGEFPILFCIRVMKIEFYVCVLRPDVCRILDAASQICVAGVFLESHGYLRPWFPSARVFYNDKFDVYSFVVLWKRFQGNCALFKSFCNHIWISLN